MLTRTLAHAKSAAEKQGLDKPTPAQMELKLIQSKNDIEAPPASVTATILWRLSHVTQWYQAFKQIYNNVA